MMGKGKPSLRHRLDELLTEPQTSPQPHLSQKPQGSQEDGPRPPSDLRPPNTPDGAVRSPEKIRQKFCGELFPLAELSAAVKHAVHHHYRWNRSLLKPTTTTTEQEADCGEGNHISLTLTGVKKDSSLILWWCDPKKCLKIHTHARAHTSTEDVNMQTRTHQG